MRLIAVFLITFTMLGSALGQDDEAVSRSVPDRVMSQAVRRILASYFKPAPRRREVRISGDGIKRSWLPRINNVRFVIVPYSNVESYESVYEFAESRMEGTAGYIWFGKFYPTAGGSGDIWKFSADGHRLRIWRTSEQWGSSGVDRGLTDKRGEPQ